MNIHKKVWNSSNLMSAKTSTALMLGPKREFLAFGYDAETKYSESEGSFASYYYFHCFKLILQDNDVWVLFFFSFLRIMFYLYILTDFTGFATPDIKYF